ncbi:hypothetical protein ACLMJK_001559 [Lecanora helva]
MESPRSESGERSQTRFSTPVSELDDHRHQSSTRPRRDTVGSGHGPHNPMENRNAFPIVEMGEGRPDFLNINDELRNAGSISRDFEQAIIDDDRSGHGERVIERKGSVNPTGPAVPRRGRRSQNHLGRSRESSTSSRSTSPANSVDAFAKPRRRERTNTIGSKGPSELDLGLQRTHSGSTHRRSRRPTFNNGSVRNLNIQTDDCASYHEATNDVCFPTSDESEKGGFSIDFEELDDFVAQSMKKPRVSRQRHSFSSHGQKPKIFDDLRTQNIPKIVTQSSSSLQVKSDSVIGDGDVKINDKDGASDDFGGVLKEKELVETEPTRYSFFNSELEQTVHAVDFADLFAPGETSRDLFSLPPDDGGVWWLDITNPTEEELHVFQRAFGIHRLTTEDIVTQEAREKVELFKQYYFVCFRSFFQVSPTHEDYMDPVSIYMIVFRTGILTITYKESPHAANVRTRIGKLRDYMMLSADWICYAMIDNIVDTFGPPIHTIEMESETIEDQVFVARTEDFTPLLRQIGDCRKKVMSLMRLLGGKADVIKGFAKRCNESYSVTPRGEVGLYLSDVQDHVVTQMSNLGHFEKMLSRSHSNYLAQLSVDNIRQGNRANEVLSKITLLATILVPLNLICGLFGMNVPVPGKDSAGLGWFFGILGVIGVFVALSLGVARKYRFI